MSDEKITIIPNGIDIEKIQQATPFPRERPLILYIGRMDRYKNVHLMVQAMPYLPDTDFIIIGKDGNFQGKIEALISKLDLGERVQILDRVSDIEKYRWLKSCSLFVNLSSIEAFGITVLEALGAGKPVVVNDKGGLKELAEKFNQISSVDADYMISTGEPGDLTSVIRRRLGEQVTIDLTEFQWDRIAHRVDMVYRSCR